MRPVLVFFGVFALVGTLLWSAMSQKNSKSSEATLLDAADSAQATPTVFPEPVSVTWEGRITRILAGGRGWEVWRASASDHWFFAYGADDAVLASGSDADIVQITGLWQGISCEYGRCAPEVEIQTVERQPILVE